MTPTTTLALPSSPAPTKATTPEPSCFLPSSASGFRSFGATPLTVAAEEADAGDRLAHRRRRLARAAAQRELLARLGELALELAPLLDQRLDARRRIGRRDLERRRDRLQPLVLLVEMAARRLAGQRLDAAHAGRDRAFADEP